MTERIHPERTYKPLWDRVKKREVVTVECHPLLVERVRKAVIQEKWRDDGFKLLNESERIYLQFTYDKDKQHLTVLIKTRFGLDRIRS